MLIHQMSAPGKLFFRCIRAPSSKGKPLVHSVQITSMDFRKDRPLVLKGSTSALCNNLSVVVNEDKRMISYAVVHKSVVNLVTAATDGSSANHRQIICKEPSASHGTSMVLQVRLLYKTVALNRLNLVALHSK